MVIVAGHLVVEAHQRAEFLAGCAEAVEQARRATGCLDYSLSADLLDDRRVNILERWQSQADLDAFRGDGTGDEQAAMIRGASVAEYDIAATRSLS